MVAKAELREKFKSILLSRKTGASSQADQDSKNLSEKLETFFKSKEGSWGAFQPLKDEPQLLSGLSEIQHIDWYFPRIKNETMEFSNGQQLKAHSLGFAEPQDGEIKPIQEMTGFLVPGLAFDKKGNRLGRGKGYYDRSLEGYSGTLVGVCFHEQLVSKLDAVEAHDLVMNYIVTEKEIVTCGSQTKGS